MADNGQTKEATAKKESIETVEVLESTALESTIRGEIDAQVTTAKRYPRSLSQFLKRSTDLIQLDEDTAGSCFFSLPRAGKKIEGPSIRMAEITANNYGNLRIQGFIIEERREEIVARGVCHDLETNTAYQADVARRITDSKGVRYNRDMIVMTGNAAISIAMRNAIFRIVPKPLIDQLTELAMATARGKLETLVARRDKAFAFFESKGIDAKRVLARLERNGIEEVTLDDMVTLSGLKTALKDGEISPEEIFPKPLDIASPEYKKPPAPKDAPATSAGSAPADMPTPADATKPSQARTDATGKLL